VPGERRKSIRGAASSLNIQNRKSSSSYSANTLIETAKLNGVGPQAWLTDVLGRISDHKVNRLNELFPWRYAQV
jgi:hypothetical protein